MKKPAPRRVSAFTGRDLLDQVYGYVTNYPVVKQLRCSCGRGVYAVDSRVQAVECRECMGSLLVDDGVRVMNWERFVRDSNIVRNADGREYEFFANRWWKLEKWTGNRLHPVKNAELLADLEVLRNGPPPAPKPPVPKLQSYTWKPAEGFDGRGRVRITPCRCSGPEAHAAFADRPHLLRAYCVKHPDACGTCGEDHGKDD